MKWWSWRAERVMYTRPKSRQPSDWRLKCLFCTLLDFSMMPLCEVREWSIISYTASHGNNLQPSAFNPSDWDSPLLSYRCLSLGGYWSRVSMDIYVCVSVYVKGKSWAVLSQADSSRAMAFRMNTGINEQQEHHQHSNEKFMCLCVGCTHILLLLFLSHSSVCHLLSGVIQQSDFTVRCSNFAFNTCNKQQTQSKWQGDRQRQTKERKKEKEISLEYRQKRSPRFASKSRTLFRNAFEIKRDGNNLKRMHAVRLWWFTVPTMLLGVFMRWQRRGRRQRQYWQRAPDETAWVWVPTTLSSLHNLKRSEGYVYAIPFYT